MTNATSFDGTLIRGGGGGQDTRKPEQAYQSCDHSVQFQFH